MNTSQNFLRELSQSHQDEYKKSKIILSFDQFLDLVQERPRSFMRNASQYLVDTFDYFKKRPADDRYLGGLERFCLFDLGTTRGVKLIGGEKAQNEIHNALVSSVKFQAVSKLILLHGPNGSAKSSTVETIAHAMEKYSQDEDGAVYRFSWVFPTDKNATPISQGESLPIGFASDPAHSNQGGSYAHLDESKIAAKIVSEFKENPLYLLPSKQRQRWLRRWLAAHEGVSEDAVVLPPHILANGLSKKNQQIFDNLLNAYAGNLSKVYKHIQVERFFFSRQYRVGISTVEPQVAIDAMEKQITLDRNYSQLPAVLHTINFYESQGELVEANRGMIDLSDLLKRPVEAFKYLLSTLEKQTINLPSGTASLDMVFFGTSNEKHLDSFKTIPDFSSFKGRFELITVPYLLIPEQEEQIYAADMESLKKIKPIVPDSLRLLCTWAVMTRLKQPDPEQYPKKYRGLISKLDPFSKLRLYSGKKMQPEFSTEDQNTLKEIREQIYFESSGMIVFEGRFGASPREIRSLLHRAALNPKHTTLTPMAIFEELAILTRDRTVYEFLQFEPRAQYHDALLFIDIIKREFLSNFEYQVIQAMTMADEAEYDILLKRYVDHVVAQIKNEKIWDESTNSYIPPSAAIMEKIEKILDIKKSAADHRAGLLSQIAAYRLEHPEAVIHISVIFEEYLTKIKKHYYIEKEKIIYENFKIMIAVAQNDIAHLTQVQIDVAKTTFANLERLFGYDQESGYRCLQFLLTQNKHGAHAAPGPLPAQPAGHGGHGSHHHHGKDAKH